MYLDEYEKLVIRMSTPRVVIDNAVCPTATLVKVDSARKHGFLLEAVQVLTDLDLSINKAYISSDGRWFMDVFHVTDRHGQKLTDDKVLSYIERSLEAVDHLSSQSNGGQEAHLTPLELSAADRPGLLSEVFAVLADLRCGVADARVWTHAGRIAMVVQVRDEDSGGAIEDERKILGVEARLRHVIKGDRVRVLGAGGGAGHAERRLHQMMVEDRDYERTAEMEGEEEPAVSVSVQNWVERGYSVVTAVSRDRPKLLFDVMCTLTDMEYVVFHGTIDTDGDRARQEFYVRHKDGSPISSEAERHRVILCLQAAIERRASEGLRLELCTTDRRGLLSEVTRTFRENGLMVARAEISTKGQTASNVFYVTDAAGQRPDLDLVESVRQRVGPACLQVVEEPRPRFHRKALAAPDAAAGAGLFSLGSLVLRNLYNLGLIRSCS